ncbi:hypothetical protein [Myxococcus sp. CA040A]|uniref:hypothetical protein n=1 Tax=Myxococcus sp. CA040A TaxID=2741738 RepID=UPI00157AE357|nr:hypothetical protein [Myxococcus sp. CA040A]NTX09055.1 hypothetical protein [Myxococcus sp. CA040A]
MFKTYGQSYNVPTQQAAEVKYRRTLRATGFEPDAVERIMASCFPHDAVWVDIYITLRERFCP